MEIQVETVAVVGGVHGSDRGNIGSSGSRNFNSSGSGDFNSSDTGIGVSLVDVHG